MNSRELKLILVDPQYGMTSSWEKHFAEFEHVEIVNNYFESLPEFDCMVSAANSFGLMDGGVDLAITRFFGKQLEDRVQKHIIENYLGEQPVGTSFIIETNHPRHPYLAHTPTMRTPITIALTDYAYIAMWALLVEVNRFNQTAKNPIKSIACPGLGTATGQMPFPEAARQMALAYKHFLNPPKFISWCFADGIQQSLRRGGDLGILYKGL